MSLPSLASSVAIRPLALWFVLLSIKHVVADFYLQSQWMALGKDRPTGWFRPLLTHCLIHGALTSVLVLLLAPALWSLGLVDFAIHIVVDRCKGVITCRYKITPDDRPFWAMIGIDQTLHHLTGFMLAVILAAG